MLSWISSVLMSGDETPKYWFSKFVNPSNLYESVKTFLNNNQFWLEPTIDHVDQNKNLYLTGTALATAVTTGYFLRQSMMMAINKITSKSKDLNLPKTEAMISIATTIEKTLDLVPAPAPVLVAAPTATAKSTAKLTHVQKLVQLHQQTIEQHAKGLKHLDTKSMPKK